MSRLSDAKQVDVGLRQLYGKLDAKVASNIEKAGHVPSCKKGCDACCKIMTVVTIAEAMVLALEIYKKPDWRSLLPALRESALAMSPIGLTEYDYAQKRLPCVFLKDGACSVYESRPAACRYYFVVSDPLLCDASNTQTVGSIDTMQAKAAVMSASGAVFGEPGFVIAPLPLMVIAALALLVEKPADQTLMEGTMLDLPSPEQWCEAKIHASIEDLETFEKENPGKLAAAISEGGL